VFEIFQDTEEVALDPALAVARAVRPFDERLVAEWMRSIPGDCVSFFGTASNDFPLLRAPCSSQAHMNCVG